MQRRLVSRIVEAREDLPEFVKQVGSAWWVRSIRGGYVEIYDDIGIDGDM